MDKESLHRKLEEHNITLNVYPTLSRIATIRSLIYKSHEPCLVLTRSHTEEIDIKSSININDEDIVKVSTLNAINCINSETFLKDDQTIIFTHPISDETTFDNIIKKFVDHFRNISIYIIIKTLEIQCEELRFILQILKIFPGTYTIDKLIFEVKNRSEKFNKIYPNTNIFKYWKEKEIKSALSFLLTHNLITKWGNTVYKSPLPKFERIEKKIYTTVYDFTKKLIRKPLRSRYKCNKCKQKT